MSLQRERLMALLLEQTLTSVELVIAPPGYGKTTVLRDYAAHDDGAQLVAMPEGADLEAFIRAIVAGDRAGGVDLARCRLRRSQRPGIGRARRRLAHGALTRFRRHPDRRRLPPRFGRRSRRARADCDHRRDSRPDALDHRVARGAALSDGLVDRARLDGAAG